MNLDIAKSEAAKLTRVIDNHRAAIAELETHVEVATVQLEALNKTIAAAEKAAPAETKK